MTDKDLNFKKLKTGLTLVEMVIALAIMVVVMAVLLPQITAINKGWDSRIQSSEVLQNGRVLTSHINHNLRTAIRIIDVSESGAANGFIVFKANDKKTYRYEVSAGNMVQFGLVGSLSDLAGPVSNFQLTCYDAYDLDTPLVIATDGVDGIRFVKTAITMINSAQLGQDKDFIASAYLRTNTLGRIGMWKLDDASGLTALDSSGGDNHGTLTNMDGDEWITGIIGGGLDFVGSNDYIAIAHSDDFLIDNGTISLWFNASNVSSRGELFSKDSQYADTGGHLTIYVESSRVKARMQDTSDGYSVSSGNALQANIWYHLAFSWGSDGMKLYLDGLEVDTDPYTGGLGTTSGGIGNYEPLALGACTWISGDLVITPLTYYFDGALDNVHIYNQTLTAEDVAALANVLMIRGATGTKISTAATSVAINTPSGIVEDDLLIAAVSVAGNESSYLSPPLGEGWNAIDINNSSSAVTLGAWWKLADAAESSAHTFTWGSDHEAYAWMMRYTGHDTSNPIVDYTADNGQSASPTSPSVTAPGTNLVLRLGAFENSDITTDYTGLTDHTTITMDASSIAGGSAYGVSVKDNLEFKNNAVVDGVLGQPTFTTNSTANNKVLFQNGPIVNADILVGPGGDPGTVIRFASPWNGQFNGTAGTLDAVVDVPTSIAEPGLGASIGDVTYSSGTTVISSDIHCDTLTIDGTAIIQIDGNVTILVEGNVLVTDDAEIQLLAGATLDFYAKGQTDFMGNSQVNVNTADPARFRLYHIAESVVEKKMTFKDYTTVYAQMYSTSTFDTIYAEFSRIYGTFQGWRFSITGDSHFSVDFGSVGGGSGSSVSGGAGYQIRPSGGSSGSDDFALTASNRYCTLTIAIDAAYESITVIIP